MSIPDRNDKCWGPIPLPGHIKEIRPQQWDVINEGLEAFASGEDVLFVEAPTGAGKSFIAEGIRRLMLTRHRMPNKAIYSCTTKALQDQLVESFPYGKVIKGRANYLTELGKVDEFGSPWSKNYSAITCADCTWNNFTEDCNWCTFRFACPYQRAKSQAINAELAILNTSYFLTDARFAGQFVDRDLVILDECDLIEKEILNQVGVDISPARMDRLGLPTPEFKTKEESWARWIYAQALPKIEDYLDNMIKPWEDGASATDIKEYNGLQDLHGRLKYIKPQIAMGNWVYDGYDTEDRRVRFSPIQVDRFGEKVLWPKGKKFIMMSATILSADLMAEDLGLYLPYYSISVPSTFPIENRPVFVVPIADMGFKAKEASGGGTWHQMANAIQAVMARHPDERILVHTVSYELAQFFHHYILSQDNSRRLITYSSSTAKGMALQEYKRNRNAVMFAASMDRGIDLPDDLCRVQVWSKVPFPNHKADKRVAARMRTTGGNNWYTSQVVRTIVQGTGRGVRHDDDHATTYILDKQFTDNIWQKGAYLFPEWWKESMRWDMTPRELLTSR